jgi:hypothetical protein
MIKIKKINLFYKKNNNHQLNFHLLKIEIFYNLKKILKNLVKITYIFINKISLNALNYSKNIVNSYKPRVEREKERVKAYK